ncbi:MAG: hypothetical protein JOZ19_06565 [Rubrobacter sp.]|nr:hypothetical protein [Rubrobacter sp.]
MRRIKVILAAVAAMMMIAALSAPAMAQPVPTCYGFCGNSDPDDYYYGGNPNYYGGNPNYYNSDPDDYYYGGNPNYYGGDCRWVQDYDGDWFQDCD